MRWPTLARVIYKELVHVLKSTNFELDVRLGAVIYMRNDSGWSLLTTWMDTTSMAFYQSTPSSPAPYDFNTAMQKAIEMEWREGAAPVVVFTPLVSPPPDTRSNTNELMLCRQVRAQRMLLVSIAFIVFHDNNRLRYLTLAQIFSYST